MKPVNEWPADAQVRYHEVMSKLTEWMGEEQADAEARRRVRREWVDTSRLTKEGKG